jgi:hypothetical protein
MGEERDHCVLLGWVRENSLVRINPIYNGRFDRVEKAKEFFKNKAESLRLAGKL